MPFTIITTFDLISLVLELAGVAVISYFMWKESLKMQGKIWIAFAIIYIAAGLKFKIIGIAVTLAAAIIYNETKNKGEQK